MIAKVFLLCLEAPDPVDLPGDLAQIPGPARIHRQERFLSRQQKENRDIERSVVPPGPGPNHNDIKTSSTALGSHFAQGDKSVP
jgi:hypothetical protein